MHNKLIAEYALSDIIDLKWSCRPNNVDTDAGNISARNDLVVVSFKEGTDITITMNEFNNFEEIRCYLFDYCVDNKIIEVRPLEQRKRSRLKNP